MLYATEACPTTTEVLTRLRRNNNTAKRWICSKRLSDRIRTKTLRARLQMNMFDDVLRWNRLIFHGLVRRMEDDIWPKRIMALYIKMKNLRGRTKNLRLENVQLDVSCFALSVTDISDRNHWRIMTGPN